ncbi:MAG: AAA-like domain-containing protein [Paludibacteraceae bacterium]|nr:AAA-like domain-containing protein [Paludibacteraceae bacterium]
MKTFNTAGTCRPNEHYMVDITERLEIIHKMVVRGDYFCINRGRQYGKTTTLKAISNNFSNEFCVFSLSFEGLADSAYADEEKLYATIAYQMADAFEWSPLEGLDNEVGEYISAFSESHDEKCNEKDLAKFISNVNHRNSKPIVLLIDEVDQAGNYPSFLKLLALLRRMYLDRDVKPTFQSVILAGVYDIKNLKLKIRTEDEHQYNSPWNIAVPFDVDMSLSAKGIAGMLAEYKADHNLTFDEVFIGQMIRDYTAGYPFLVSRICQIIDAEQYTWDKEGVLKATHDILVERNTLFDDMVKKLDQYPELKELLRNILFEGKTRTFHTDEKYLQIGLMFNFLANNNGTVAIACRLMETRLYNLFIGENETSRIFSLGQMDKNQFVHDGFIDMRLLMERFCVHFNEIYRPEHDDQFVEDNGRKIFLTYLRPIINGIGNYYCEAQTRDLTRTDIIIDYLGQQYIVELKIWRGQSYNERGEKQLAEYLERYNQKTGYMVSFCFNKNKQSGLLPPVELNGRTLIEAIV